MKTALICHHDAPLDFEGLARWMASFSEVVGIVIIEEAKDRQKKRIENEIKRIGKLRLVDVLAFRVFYKVFQSAADKAWKQQQIEALKAKYPSVANVPVLRVTTPNSPEVEAFLKEKAPDLCIARCKFILKESVFSIPKHGIVVMHPGICPEYRNSHGCFWAIAEGDKDKVGMTLLRIDKGVDTGPIWGYFTYPYDEAKESHVQIQTRVVLDNLDAIRAKLEEVVAGKAVPLKTDGRPSAVWGQPWMTKYLKLRARAARR